MLSTANSGRPKIKAAGIDRIANPGDGIGSDQFSAGPAEPLAVSVAVTAPEARSYLAACRRNSPCAFSESKDVSSQYSTGGLHRLRLVGL